MSDLEDLADIADASAFGAWSIRGNPHRPGMRPTEHCAGGHLWTEESTRWFRCRGRLSRACRRCEEAKKTGKKP